MRLRDAGDRGRDEEHAGDEEDRAEFVHAASTAPRQHSSLDLLFKAYYSAKQNSVDQAQLLKGVLELAVLAVISKGETYGYEILSTLEGAGFDGVGDASVYGTLRRLEQAGHVTSRLAASDSGPARKYYSVTPSGTDQLHVGTDSWTRINGALDMLVQP
jgi:PadR family transcriptional regulator PadR